MPSPAAEQRAQIDLCIVALKHVYSESLSGTPIGWRPPAVIERQPPNDHQATAAVERQPVCLRQGQ